MDATSITIARDGPGHFNVAGNGRVGHGLNFDEMLAAVISLTHPQVRAFHPTLTGVASEAAEPRIMISLSVDEACRVSESMADLLCWVRGFRAARPDDFDAHPLGVEGFRDLRIKLRRAIGEATGQSVETDLPF